MYTSETNTTNNVVQIVGKVVGFRGEVQKV